VTPTIAQGDEWDNVVDFVLRKEYFQKWMAAAPPFLQPFTWSESHETVSANHRIVDYRTENSLQLKGGPI